MQKFMITKSVNRVFDSSDREKSITSPIKLSGYLERKRNKMGGWQKLWFVLQNQLLMSYSSKDDYERKLEPFKDVLSLVPGTTVLPSKERRFFIETSTNIIFTYRCEDIKTCSKWITALVENLLSGSMIKPTIQRIDIKNDEICSAQNFRLHHNDIRNRNNAQQPYDVERINRMFDCSGNFIHSAPPVPKKRIICNHPVNSKYGMAILKKQT